MALEAFKIDLLSFIRSYEIYAQLKFEIIVLKQDTEKTIPLTSKDKFMALAQKNESLAYLKSKFFLEIE